MLLARQTRYQDPPPRADYWMSYSDLMAGVLMMFILMFVLTINELGKAVQEQVGVNADIVEALQEAFATSATDLKIQVDPQSGAIVFGEGILFEFNSAKLSPQGKLSLKRFFPGYEKVLLGTPKFKAELAELIIEGHTDSVGGYLSNLTLSQRRASALAEFLLGPEYTSPYKQDLMLFLTANGRSEIMPAADNVTEQGRAMNRRIEFKFRLKDDKALERVRDLLKAKQ